MKAGGSLARGRRHAHEVPPIPKADELTSFERRVQDELRTLVERAGGRMGLQGSRPIPVGDISLLTDAFDRWARLRSTTKNGRDYFSGRPGFWHAFDEYYPLQDPNRWDGLRAAVTTELTSRGWDRIGAPKGSSWYLPDDGSSR